MSIDGYFLVARGMLSHPRFKPKGAYSCAEAWLWLIENAAYLPRDVAVMVGADRRVIHLEPGQLTYSVRYLAKAWDWSPNRVQRFFDVLRMDDSVATATDTPQTVITLCNYIKYQRPNEQADTATDTRSNTRSDTNKKEGKERKQYKPSGRGFAEWYSAYGKKVNPKEAAKAYARVIAAGDISESLLLDRTKAFAAKWANEPKERRQFMPYPASWLNKGGYASEQDNGTAESAGIVDPLAFTDEQWRKRLTYSHEASRWLETWGPKPGAPGCLVPSHLLLNPVAKARGAA